MSDYCLSCCSAVDLTPEQMEQRNIHYICFQYTVDEEVYADDMGICHRKNCLNAWHTEQKQRPHKSV